VFDCVGGSIRRRGGFRVVKVRVTFLLWMVSELVRGNEGEVTRGNVKGNNHTKYDIKLRTGSRVSYQCNNI